MNQIFYVYILRCRDTSLYTGYTTDIDRRLLQHIHGTASKYTRSRRPIDLVYLEKYPTKHLATRREYEIKQLSKNEKENLIKNFH